MTVACVGLCEYVTAAATATPTGDIVWDMIQIPAASAQMNRLVVVGGDQIVCSDLHLLKL